MNKYQKAASALKRALIHDQELALAKGSKKLEAFDSVAILKSISEKFSAWIVPILLLCMIGAGPLLIFLMIFAGIIGVFIVLIIGLLGALHSIQVFQAIRGQSSHAQDKVDTLMSIANLPWEIERKVLDNGYVQYGISIPPEDYKIFPGSPSIQISAQAAEKADLLILAIRADQKLIEKWSNRTLNM